MCNVYVNYIFWLLIEIISSSEGKLAEGDARIYFSIINPLLIGDEFVTAFFHNPVDVIGVLNGTSFKTVYTGCNDVICPLQHCNFIILAQNSGRCRIFQISYFSTMEHEIILEKIIMHSNNKTIMEYDPWYEKLLLNLDRGVLAQIILYYENVLKIYIDRYGLEEKSRQMFGKSLKNLDLYEVCKICGHEYSQEILSTSD
jgi:hypothetical protein